AAASPAVAAAAGLGCRAGLGAHLNDVGHRFGGDLVGDLFLIGHFAVNFRHLGDVGAFTLFALLHNLFFVLVLVRVCAGLGFEVDVLSRLLLLHHDSGDRHDGGSLIVCTDNRFIKLV